MRIALTITNQVPLQLPQGVIFASIPIHMAVAEGLARKGHEVTVFCSEDTTILPPLKKESLGLVSMYQLKKDNPGIEYAPKYLYAADMLMFSEVYRRANEGNFDIIWSNDPIRVAPFTSFTQVPTLFTLHDPLSRPQYGLLPYLQKLNHNHYYASISDAQREPLPQLEYVRTVYHGIDLERISFSEEADDYFVFFGRIIPEKGTLESIAVARKAGVKLKLIGPFGSDSPAKVAYSELVKKEIDGEQIEYLGAMATEGLLPIVSRAKAFINMVDVHESFGMVLVESMATGTPVIAKRRGSIGEVVEDGVTGFVVDSVDEAVAAVSRIDDIDRKACRGRVERLFSIGRCVDEYEKLMTEIVNKEHNG